MQYLITYQLVKYDRNGNGRAIATIYNMSAYDSTATDGRKVERVTGVDKAAITGHRDDVWDIVQRIGANGVPVIELPNMLSGFPRETTCPTVQAHEVCNLRTMSGAVIPAHVAIAAISNVVDDRKVTV